MAKNPDPTLALTNLAGRTRTLDDWATMFHLVLVVLPDRPEAVAWVPVAQRIFATFGDADCRAAFVVPSTPSVARRILDGAEADAMVFLDPDRALVTSLGLERLPAFVHLRQDTSLVTAAQGWSPTEWQRVADQIAKHEHWTSPVVTGRGDPAPTPGWPIAS